MVIESPSQSASAVPSSEFRVPSSACDHCGLPVPKALFDVSADHQFCCRGCRTAWNVIHACGLDPYYRIRRSDPAAPVASRSTGKSYEDFDDPACQARYCIPVPSSEFRVPSSIDLYLEGVHCSACVWLVEKLPQALPGVIESRLSLGQSMLRLKWDQQQVKLSRIAGLLDSLGYPPHPARGSNRRDLRRNEDRRDMIRIAVAGAAAGNVMLMALALYAGVFGGMERVYEQFFRWMSLAVASICLLWPGAVFFRGAWAAIRTRTAHLDLPIALGLGAGGIAGAVNTITGRGEIYFDSIAALTFFLLVGRFIQRRQQRQAEQSLELLFCLTPASAHRVEGSQIRPVPIESLEIGNVVEVRAGESIPVDGLVESGSSSVDQSLLTGEPRPTPVGAGDAVCAGSVNLSSTLRLIVKATGAQTRVGKLMDLVVECSRRRAPLVLKADRIAGIFTTIVILLAVGVFGFWTWAGSELAIDHSVALLIVACPCALGLATPLALAVAIGRAAKRGILIKGADTLERLARPGIMLLDKTGTLTAGQMSVVGWQGERSPEFLAAVAAIQQISSHPVARAFVQYLTPLDLPAAAAMGVIQTAKGGIEGTVSGRQYLIGSESFLTHHLPQFRVTSSAFQVDHSPVYIAVDGQLAATAYVGDPLRPDAPAAVASLKQRGWKPAILSGDHPQIVHAVAAQIGLNPADSRGGVMPEEKLRHVQTLLQPPGSSQFRAPSSEFRVPPSVVMVGDGVNDAAALAAATVGIAVHGGAEASLAAADVYLQKPGLQQIVQLTDAAARTLRLVHRNLAVSIFYNALAVGLAAAGRINPLLAAVLMPLSSLSVLALCLTSRTFKDES